MSLTCPSCGSLLLYFPVEREMRCVDSAICASRYWIGRLDLQDHADGTVYQYQLNKRVRLNSLQFKRAVRNRERKVNGQQVRVSPLPGHPAIKDVQVGMDVRYHPIIGREHDGKAYRVRSIHRLNDRDGVMLEGKAGFIAIEAISLPLKV